MFGVDKSTKDAFKRMWLVRTQRDIRNELEQEIYMYLRVNEGNEIEHASIKWTFKKHEF